MTVGGVVDTLLDRSVVLGFSQIGLSVRSRLPGWPADPPGDALLGRDVAVTGATSGLGLATALGVARLGARVHLVVRQPAKAQALHLILPCGVVRVLNGSMSASLRTHNGPIGARWRSTRSRIRSCLAGEAPAQIHDVGRGLAAVRSRQP